MKIEIDIDDALAPTLVRSLNRSELNKLLLRRREVFAAEDGIMFKRRFEKLGLARQDEVKAEIDAVEAQEIPAREPPVEPSEEAPIR